MSGHPDAAPCCSAALEKIAFNLTQSECDPRQASRWECGVAFDRLNPIKGNTP
jgi:hypothetical protein